MNYKESIIAAVLLIGLVYIFKNLSLEELGFIALAVAISFFVACMSICCLSQPAAEEYQPKSDYERGFQDGLDKFRRMGGRFYF